MDIERLGDKLIDQLVDKGLLKTFADIYRLKKEGTARPGADGRSKRQQNVVEAIEGSRKQGLDRLLAGLGIRHVGNRVAYRPGAATSARSTRWPRPTRRRNWPR